MAYAGGKWCSASRKRPGVGAKGRLGQATRRSALQRRKWEAHTKAMTVLEGLRGKPVAEICAEHQISPSLYYQWRDQFLANAGKAFEAQKRTRE
jgi:transposase-like protein